jgi:RNA polymerase sigma-70 factor (ECF subfamily)
LASGLFLDDSKGRAVTAVDEASLVRRAQDGDEQAFMALVVRYEEVIFRLTLALLRHREDAEDATQDTFVHAFCHLRTLRDVHAFPFWLRRIAIRLCLRRRRRTQKCPEIAELPDEWEAIALFPESTLDPAAEAERAELHRLLRRAVAELPQPFQVAVILYHLDRLSYDEIAQVLNVPIGTVRSRLARARAMLRAKLAPLLEGGVGCQSSDANEIVSISQGNKTTEECR